MAFVEFRNYSQVDLTRKGGWDQYLPKTPEGGGIPTAPAVTAVVLNVVAPDAGVRTPSGFFAPRTTTAPEPAASAPLTTAVVVPTVSAGQTTAVDCGCVLE